jgi:hypothetical protein
VGNPEGGLNLWALDGVSAREIGRTLGVARSTIQDNLRRAHAIGIARPGYNQGQPLTFTWIGTATTTVLTGSNYGSNIFDLGPGGDTVTGGNTNLGGDGTNTVVFDKGVGHAIVDLNGGVGTMQIAADIATSDVILQADNNGNLTVISRRKRLRETDSLVCGQLFSSLFFFDFHRTNFSGFRRTFHQFRSGRLLLFLLLTRGARVPHCAPLYDNSNIHIYWI